MRHFNTTANEYDVVFTTNATAALKLVAETFHFEQGGFYYCQENHTSILGMRELVATENIFVLTLEELLQESSDQSNAKLHSGNALVAFSAQCNYSGYKIPLEIIDTIHGRGLCTQGKRVGGRMQDTSDTTWRNHRFHVLLDAASYAATNYLDLSRYHPDFICLSFYKIFGQVLVILDIFWSYSLLSTFTDHLQWFIGFSNVCTGFQLD